MQVLRNQEYRVIHNEKTVKLTDMGNIKELMYMEKVNHFGMPVIKINKDQYVIKNTGEIREYSHTENRLQNKDNLRRTFKHIRELINTNFKGGKNELAFTITYAENMTDTKQLYKDCDRFFKKLKYKYPDFDYMSVVEPQGRGAWHCHVMIRFNSLDSVYIPNKAIAEMWGHGFVSVKSIKRNVDNLGAYLSAYLGDVEYNTENIKILSEEGIKVNNCDVRAKEVDGVSKKFIKGGRLYLYPSGMNIYRKSRGIREPERKYMTYENAKKIVGSANPNYSVIYNIVDDDNIEINTIIYEQYNMKK